MKPMRDKSLVVHEILKALLSRAISTYDTGSKNIGRIIPIFKNKFYFEYY
jgi:hypothetical protein